MPWVVIKFRKMLKGDNDHVLLHVLANQGQCHGIEW